MGRVLDVLSRNGAPKVMPPAAPPEVTAPEEEVPFIEVGPKGSALEASAAVLAAPLPAGYRPFVPKVEDTHKPAAFKPVPKELLPLPPVSERFAPELVAYHRPEDGASVALRRLFASIRETAGDGPRAILFQAAAAESGTTTVLLNVAITAAREGDLRVVVVDAARERPAVARLLGLHPAPGVAEALSGSVTVESALQESGLPNLVVLTAGEKGGADGIRLAGGEMRGLLSALRERFDLVFVDASHWEGRPGDVGLAGLCDGVYLVVRESQQESGAVAEVMRAVAHQTGRLRGCVLTHG